MAICAKTGCGIEYRNVGLVAEMRLRITEGLLALSIAFALGLNSPCQHHDEQCFSGYQSWCWEFVGAPLDSANLTTKMTVTQGYGQSPHDNHGI